MGNVDTSSSSFDDFYEYNDSNVETTDNYDSPTDADHLGNART
jgi:hypothetical protein